MEIDFLVMEKSWKIIVEKEWSSWCGKRCRDVLVICSDGFKQYLPIY